MRRHTRREAEAGRCLGIPLREWPGPGSLADDPDIYTMNACGQAVTRLTFHGGHFAKLSPDGKRIAFSGPEPGASTHDIWIMRADGSDLRDLTNFPDTNDAFPAAGAPIAAAADRRTRLRVPRRHDSGTGPGVGGERSSSRGVC